jgi:hypothetical protein
MPSTPLKPESAIPQTTPQGPEKAYSKTRSKILFPAGLDPEAKRFEAAMASHQAKDALVPASTQIPQLMYELYKEGLSLRRLRSIEVTFALYCKSNGGLQHEFVLLEVVDRSIGVPNFMIIDRGVKRGKSALRGIDPANDWLKISADGTYQSLLRFYELENSTIIESLQLSGGDRPSPLITIVLFAWSVTGIRADYNLFESQCYWFASSLWECMLEWRPARHQVFKGDRGRFGIIRWQTTKKGDLDLIFASANRKSRRQQDKWSRREKSEQSEEVRVAR